MIVSIFSLNAAVVGKPDVVWTGEVVTQIEPFNGIRQPEFEGGPPAEDLVVLSRLFRYFNVVDEADARRLHREGYNLPSLSVGDFVSFEGKTWQICPVGFKEITGDASMLMGLYA